MASSKIVGSTRKAKIVSSTTNKPKSTGGSNTKGKTYPVNNATGMKTNAPKGSLQNKNANTKSRIVQTFYGQPYEDNEEDFSLAGKKKRNGSRG